MATPTLHINQPRLGDEQSLSDRAYYAIREWIVTLELAPGSVVSERDMMERLGVGRTPVREALRDLAREQLVEVFPRRGIFVSTVDVGDIADQMQLPIAQRERQCGGCLVEEALALLGRVDADHPDRLFALRSVHAQRVAVDHFDCCPPCFLGWSGWQIACDRCSGILTHHGGSSCDGPIGWWHGPHVRHACAAGQH